MNKIYYLLLIFALSNYSFSQNKSAEINLAFFDKLIDNKSTNNDLKEKLNDYIVSWENKKYSEFNEETGEHDLIVSTPEIILDYKGSTLNIQTKSFGENGEIYSVTVGFRCKCDWFNITNQAKLNGYKITSVSDNPDSKKSVFGGIEKKFRKINKTIFYHQFHSRPYFEFSINKDKLKSNKPTTSADYLALAKIKAKTNTFEARGFLNKAIELDKNNAEAHFFWALISSKFDDYSFIRYEEGSQAWEAMKYYNKALELDNTKDEYYFNRGELFYAIKKFDDAIIDYKKTIELNPNNEKAQLDLIDIYTEKKDYNQALKVVNDLLQKNQTNSEIYIKRALIKWNQNNTESACKDFKKAKEIGIDMSGRLDLIDLNQRCR